MKCCVIVGAMLLVACADTPVESPTGLRKYVASASSLTSSYSSDGNFLSLVGAEGYTYTLDIDGRTLSRHDGATLELTLEQTVDATNAMLGIIQNDAVSNHFEGMPDPGCSGDPYEPCVEEPASIGGPTEPDSVTMATASSGQFLMRRVDDGKKPKSRDEAPGEMTVMAYGDMCSDILGALVPSINQFKTRRDMSLGELFTSLFGGTSVAYVRRALALTPATAGAMILQEWTANQYHAKISVGVLAAFWNSWNCTNKVPTYYTGRPSGGSTSKVCHNESWEISFNGGDTWFSVTVQVCTVYAH